MNIWNSYSLNAPSWSTKWQKITSFKLSLVCIVVQYIKTKKKNHWKTFGQQVNRTKTILNRKLDITDLCRPLSHIPRQVIFHINALVYWILIDVFKVSLGTRIMGQDLKLTCSKIMTTLRSYMPLKPISLLYVVCGWQSPQLEF